MPRSDARLILAGNIPNPLEGIAEGREIKTRNKLLDLATQSNEFQLESAKEDREASKQSAGKLARATDFAIDTLKLKTFVDNEDMPGAVRHLQKRLQQLESTGRDTKDTELRLQLLNQGQGGALASQLESDLVEGQQAGIIEPVGNAASPSQKSTPFRVTRPDGSQVVVTPTFDPNSNSVELIETPFEGSVQSSLGETPAERQRREELTAGGKRTNVIDADLSRSDQTAGAAAEQARQVEAARQEAQVAAIPEKVQAQFEAEFAAEAPKRIQAANSSIARIDGVMEEANLAIQDISGSTTGIQGQALRNVAGTSAFALARKIDTIQANLSFDRIAEMRKNSPTGGALGQVSERELSLLGAAVVSLDQANSEEEVRRAFEKVLTHYNNWKAVISGQVDADEALLDGQPQTTQPQTETFDDGTTVTFN